MEWKFIVETALPEWNKRVHTEQDLYQFCEEEGVRIKEIETGEPGMYLVHRGQPFIVIAPNLTGGCRLWVFAHEVGHHLLHIPGTQLFDGCERKVNRQANIVAACLLIPKRLVESKTAWELHDEYDYPPELLRFRFDLFRQMKF